MDGSWSGFAQASLLPPGFSGPLSHDELWGLAPHSPIPWRQLQLSDRFDVWCILDEADYDFFRQWHWCHTYGSGRQDTPARINKLYARRAVSRSNGRGGGNYTVWLHREILQRVDPRPASELTRLVGDHINGNSLDNRRCNLRWATFRDNARNIHGAYGKQADLFYQNLPHWRSSQASR